MKPRTVEALAWVLIYSGLLLAVLGLFVLRQGAPWGGVLTTAGLLDAAAGVALVWARSRMNDKETR